MNISITTLSLRVSTSTSTSAVSDATPVATSAPASADLGSATAADVSKPAEFLAALQGLKDSNPAKFKEVVSQLAQEVRDQAKDATSRERGFLNHFAAKLDEVANTGDLSALRPHWGHEHGHGRGVKAYPPAPPPPPSGASSVGDGDGQGASSAVQASSGTDLREAMETLLAKLTAAVKDATASATGPAATDSAGTAVTTGTADAPAADAPTGHHSHHHPRTTEASSGMGEFLKALTTLLTKLTSEVVAATSAGSSSTSGTAANGGTPPTSTSTPTGTQ